MLFLVVCSVPEYQPSIISCFLFHIALSDPVIHNINRTWHHWMFKHHPVKQAQTYHWPTPALSLFWALRFYMTSDLTKEGLNIYTQPHVHELEELGSHVQEELAGWRRGGGGNHRLTCRGEGLSLLDVCCPTMKLRFHFPNWPPAPCPPTLAHPPSLPSAVRILAVSSSQPAATVVEIKTKRVKSAKVAHFKSFK